MRRPRRSKSISRGSRIASECSLRPRCPLCHEHPGSWCENTHRIELFLSSYEPAPIRWPVMGLPVRAGEKGSVWRIDLATNRIRLLHEPANGGGGFGVSALTIRNRYASYQKNAEREFLISGKHKHGLGEFPHWQRIQRESRHSGAFSWRREDASYKFFPDRPRHEHRDEKETARRFLPCSHTRGVSSRFAVQVIEVRHRRQVFAGLEAEVGREGPEVCLIG